MVADLGRASSCAEHNYNVSTTVLAITLNESDSRIGCNRYPTLRDTSRFVANSPRRARLECPRQSSYPVSVNRRWTNRACDCVSTGDDRTQWIMDDDSSIDGISSMDGIELSISTTGERRAAHHMASTVPRTAFKVQVRCCCEFIPSGFERERMMSDANFSQLYSRPNRSC